MTSDAWMIGTIWMAGSVAWLLLAAVVVWLSRKAPDEETIPMQRYVSPGMVREMWITPIQRHVLIYWIDEIPDAARPLRSFRKQLANTERQGAWVPVYRNQMQPLLDLVNEKGMISVARVLKDEQ